MGIITMIASGKDGVGKTTTSVMLADAFDRMGKRTLVIELDTGRRSLDIVAGCSGRTVYDILDVLGGRCEPQDAIIHAPSPRKEVYIMAAPYKSEPVSGESFVKLCKVLTDKFDHILIDTAPNTGATIAAGAVAMNAIIVTTPDPMALRESRILCDRLTDLSVPSIRLLTNRVIPSRIKAGVVPNLDYCIDTVGTRLIGVIPEDDDIALSAASGKPLAQKGLCAHVFDNIAKRIYGTEVPLEMQ